MKNRSSSTQREGQIYRFSIAGTNYAAFIWHLGKQFRGRIEGHPHIPQCTGGTPLAVREALALWLSTHATV